MASLIDRWAEHNKISQKRVLRKVIFLNFSVISKKHSSAGKILRVSLVRKEVLALINGFILWIYLEKDNIRTYVHSLSAICSVDSCPGNGCVAGERVQHWTNEIIGTSIKIVSSFPFTISSCFNFHILPAAKIYEEPEYCRMYRRKKMKRFSLHYIHTIAK